jgi:hypothetical protein
MIKLLNSDWLKEHYFIDCIPTSTINQQWGLGTNWSKNTQNGGSEFIK